MWQLCSNVLYYINLLSNIALLNECVFCHITRCIVFTVLLKYFDLHIVNPVNSPYCFQCALTQSPCASRKQFPCQGQGVLFGWYVNLGLHLTSYIITNGLLKDTRNQSINIRLVFFRVTQTFHVLHLSFNMIVMQSKMVSNVVYMWQHSMFSIIRINRHFTKDMIFGIER